jgi:hypothetical protein
MRHDARAGHHPSNYALTGKQAVMAGRILNRRELRKQSDQAEKAEAGIADPTSLDAPTNAAARRKAVAAPKAKKPRKAKASPRMRALWCIYDGGMKEVALFDYNQRAAAEEKLAVLLGKHKGVYFLQLVKQPMPAAAPDKTPSLA